MDIKGIIVETLGEFPDGNLASAICREKIAERIIKCIDSELVNLVTKQCEVSLLPITMVNRCVAVLRGVIDDNYRTNK